ncbi:HD domain-containing protein [Caproiciproducens sp.]|uniref:HD domain-containing protein n=1 Tax=Caproiciproducens sp. TaxID=1954376 RepID=UPI0028A0D0ED|nr:HD domain-containing protein [Caproiciproducens sp.]
MKDEFIKIYTDNIKRDGADKLLEWLQRSDFFTTPASTKHHGAHEGGLCEHSVNVFNRLGRIYTDECNDPEKYKSNLETFTICGLLHDVCKVNFYTVSTRNVKNETTGQWEKQPYYAIDDQLPYGHGEKSVYIISGFMHLTREEAMAIRWHMGGFDDAVKGGSYAISGAFDKFPLALMLHVADLEATYIDEKEDAK